jgi:predicted RNA-binding protein with TRAM domain
MVEISDSLRLLFETSVETEDDRYVISIPKELLDDPPLQEDRTYRIALLPTLDSPTEHDSAPGQNHQRTGPDVPRGSDESYGGGTRSRSQQPPVEEGERRTVSIDTLGDQGDGIAKVERGFIIIVSGTQPGDEVDVEITHVKDSVAFAEPIGDATAQ